MQSPARSLSMLTRAGLDAADDDAVADPPLEDSALDDDPAPPVAELAGAGTCCPAPVTVLVQPASSAPPTSVTSNLCIRVPRTASRTFVRRRPRDRLWPTHGLTRKTPDGSVALTHSIRQDRARLAAIADVQPTRPDCCAACLNSLNRRHPAAEQSR